MYGHVKNFTSFFREAGVTPFFSHFRRGPDIDPEIGCHVSSTWLYFVNKVKNRISATKKWQNPPQKTAHLLNRILNRYARIRLRLPPPKHIVSTHLFQICQILDCGTKFRIMPPLSKMKFLFKENNLVSEVCVHCTTVAQLTVGNDTQ